MPIKNGGDFMDVRVAKRVLEKHMLGASKILRNEKTAINGLRADIENHLNQFILQMEAFIWTEVLQNDSKTVRFTFLAPADWWQHFKQRWFPAWALRRWPVVMARKDHEETVKFQTIAMLPSFRYEAPRFGHYALDYVIRTDVK